MTKWRCIICGYIHQGQRPPSHCPICGAPAAMFEPLGDPEGDKGPAA